MATATPTKSNQQQEADEQQRPTYGSQADDIAAREEAAAVEAEGIKDVSFDQAHDESKGGGSAESAEQAEEEAKELLEILRPNKGERTWKIGPEDMQREYVQRPLSFIAKMQWMSLVGDVLDKAMSGENALTVGSLLSGPGIDGRGGALSMGDFRDADTFIQAVGKLVSHAPEFLQDSFCIWLGVPEYERPMVKAMMAEPESNGGLSDDDGIEIIERFIDQNYEALDRFFREKISHLQKRVQARMEERNQGSQ